MLANLDIAGIDALSPYDGLSVLVTEDGTPSASGSEAVEAGDIIEYQGSLNGWRIVTPNENGVPPADTRALLAWTGLALQAPHTDGVDNGKIAIWDGSSLNPSEYVVPSDGDTLTCNGGANNNSLANQKKFGYDGVIPAGQWSETASLANNLWEDQVDTFLFMGEMTILEVDGLLGSEGLGMSFLAEDSGTPSAGGDAVVPGDISEWDGSQWAKIVDNVDGYPPSGTRALVASTGFGVTLYPPLVAGDTCKIVEWDGTSATPARRDSPIPGQAVTVRSGAGFPAGQALHNLAGFGLLWAPMGWASGLIGPGLKVQEAIYQLAASYDDTFIGVDGSDQLTIKDTSITAGKIGAGQVGATQLADVIAKSIGVSESFGAGGGTDQVFEVTLTASGARTSTSDLDAFGINVIGHGSDDSDAEYKGVGFRSPTKNGSAATFAAAVFGASWDYTQDFSDCVSSDNIWIFAADVGNSVQWQDDNDVQLYDLDTSTGAVIHKFYGTLSAQGNITVTGTVDGIDIATDVAANNSHRTGGGLDHAHLRDNVVRVDVAVSDTATDDAAITITLKELDGTALNKQVTLELYASTSQYGGPHTPNANCSIGSYTKGQAFLSDGANGFWVLQTDSNGELAATVTNTSNETVWFSCHSARGGVPSIDQGVSVAKCVPDSAVWS
jgi:hypothetical protein